MESTDRLPPKESSAAAKCSPQDVGSADEKRDTPDRRSLHQDMHSSSRIIPRLKIVIMVVGTRGDVQPFIALGQKLAFEHGHHVRLATNRMYGEFVESCGLEFFPMGGDPELLSALMVKNRGVMPGRLHELAESRSEYRSIISSCWAACTSPSLHTGDDFAPDAIISNPPASGHVHCAEKLGIHLHLVFTMPWSPTREYPHPFAPLMLNYKKKNVLNLWSHYLMETFITYGVIDIINELDPLAPLGDGPAGVLHRLRVPFSYAWSPSLTPKPSDWGEHIDVVGFMFLEGAEQAYAPPPELQRFLEAGPAPVYIGFGSMSVEDPKHLTRVIFSALEKVGQRAVVARGWANIGEDATPPPNVLLIGSVPHTWLFQRCSAVVHHGGAGTTAAGIAAGKPTLVVPFFGDQHIWGQLVAEKGLGARPIAVTRLTEDRLVDALRTLVKPSVQAAALHMQAQFQQEDGVAAAAEAFHKHLPLGALSCDICPSQTAQVFCRECDLKLCPTADKVIHEQEEYSWHGARKRHVAIQDWGRRMYRHPWHAIGLAVMALGGQSDFSGLLAEQWSRARARPSRAAARGGARGRALLASERATVLGACDLLSLPVTAVALLLHHAGTRLQARFSPRPSSSPALVGAPPAGGAREARAKHTGARVFPNNDTSEYNGNGAFSQGRDLTSSGVPDLPPLVSPSRGSWGEEEKHGRGSDSDDASSSCLPRRHDSRSHAARRALCQVAASAGQMLIAWSRAIRPFCVLVEGGRLPLRNPRPASQGSADDETQGSLIVDDHRGTRQLSLGGYSPPGRGGQDRSQEEGGQLEGGGEEHDERHLSACARARRQVAASELKHETILQRFRQRLEERAWQEEFRV
eukprot:jgi/Mesen1/10783/ME000091S10300